jgi:alpha-1,2-mannosyltransferase
MARARWFPRLSQSGGNTAGPKSSGGTLREPGLTLHGLASAALILSGISVGILGVAVFGLAFLPGRRYEDWMAFYVAARLYADHHLDVLYDGLFMTQRVIADYGHMRGQPLKFLPWVYPPTFLLLLVPFGLLPLVPGYVAFLLVTLAVMIVAVRIYAPEATGRWMFTLALALSPALAANIALGQNALLVSGLFLAAFGLLATQPVLAGVCIGLLSFKPQIGLLIPVALLAARQYRAFASAAVVTVLFAALSLAVFGIGPWLGWYEFVIGRSELYRLWTIENRLHGASIYSSIGAITGSLRLAGAAQIATILVCVGVVYRVYATRIARDAAFAILACASMLSAPHLLSYDMVLLSLGVAAMLRFSEQRQLGFGPKFACLALASAPLFTIFADLPVPPLIIAVCGGYFWYVSQRAAGRVQTLLAHT